MKLSTVRSTLSGGGDGPRTRERIQRPMTTSDYDTRPALSSTWQSVIGVTRGIHAVSSAKRGNLRPALIGQRVREAFIVTR